MKHYPEIQRRDGTLFFIPNGDRAAIAVSIERLIDLLDALEGDTDREPYLAGFDGQRDDREDDGDDLEPDHDAEYSYGWTDHVDQSLAGATNPTGTDGEGEPSLGFVGIATGWREGEDRQDSEACQLGDSETEWDFAESGVADFDALEDLEHCSFLTAAEAGLVYDGTGAIIAAELLHHAKPRREPYSEVIGTRRHFLQDGSVFTTLVPR